MLNPLDVEQRYQSLVYLLSFPATAFHRLRLLAAFAQSFGEEAAAYESYILQIAERVAIFADGVGSGGIAPEALKSLLSALESMEQSVPAVHGIDGYDRAREGLKERAVESAIYASDSRGAIRLLGGNAQELQEELNARHPSPGARRSEIERIIQASRTTQPALAGALQRALDTWGESLSLPRNSIYIPVVEQSVTGDPDAEKHGMLRCASLEVGRSKSGKGDVLHSDVAVFGAEQATSGLMSAPIAAARALFREGSPKRQSPGLSCHLHFEPKSALHEGSSANFAVAALFYCAILQDANQRIQYTLRPDVAITGDVREDGAVLPVADDGLATKTEAVFYSHVETFVVPKSQLNIAEEACKKLKVRYPRRVLNIVGISTLRELFFDLRVVEQTRISALAHGAKYVWRNRSTVAGMLLITMLLLVLGRMIYGPIDKNPVSAKWEGEELLLLNTHGDVVQSLPIGQATVAWLTSANSPTRTKNIVFFDMNGDGLNEFVYIKKSDATEGSSDSIICGGIGRDRPFWSVSSQRGVDFALRTDTKSSLMAFSDLEAGRLDANGSYRIYAIADSRPSFPGLILVWDATDGHELGCYVNIGHLNDIVLADVNGDGIKEILACGSNNAFHAAALIVLDPGSIRGYSPTRGTYVPEGMARANEALYAIIPRTIVGEQYMESSLTNPGMFLEVLPDEGKFSVTVSDAGEPAMIDGKPLMATIKYTFSYDFVLHGLGPEDGYDRIAKRLLKDGRIASVPDEVYFADFAGKIQMWKGDHFESINELGRNGLAVDKIPQVR